MINGKFIATLSALIAIVFAICNFNTQKTITENFWGGIQFGAKKSVQHQTSNGMYNVPPTWQANLAPRSLGFANVCANLRYNPTSMKNQAATMDPLGRENKMVRENYLASSAVNSQCGCDTPSCAKNGQKPVQMKPDPTLMNEGYADGNYNPLLNKVEAGVDQPKIHSALPIGTMETVNALGETENVVNYNRPMFANLANTRLRAQGDMIRGDLPITPCNTGWFQVSVNPNLDLQAGAMNVMGGVGNQTNNATSALINAQVGQTTIGGVNMSTPELASIGACTDVTFNTFA